MCGSFAGGFPGDSFAPVLRGIPRQGSTALQGKVLRSCRDPVGQRRGEGWAVPRCVPGAVRSALGDTAVPKLSARTVGALTGPPSPHGSASPKVPPPWASGAGGSAGACLDGGTEVCPVPGELSRAAAGALSRRRGRCRSPGCGPRSSASRADSLQQMAPFDAINNPLGNKSAPGLQLEKSAFISKTQDVLSCFPLRTGAERLIEVPRQAPTYFNAGFDSSEIHFSSSASDAPWLVPHSTGSGFGATSDFPAKEL